MVWPRSGVPRRRCSNLRQRVAPECVRPHAGMNIGQDPTDEDTWQPRFCWQPCPVADRASATVVAVQQASTVARCDHRLTQRQRWRGGGTHFGSQAASGPVSAFTAFGGSRSMASLGRRQHTTADTMVFEVIFRKANGDLVSVTQKDKAPLAIGQRVLVIAGNQAKVLPDPTVPPSSGGAMTAKPPEAGGRPDRAADPKPGDPAKAATAPSAAAVPASNAATPPPGANPGNAPAGPPTATSDASQPIFAAQSLAEIDPWRRPHERRKRKSDARITTPRLCSAQM